jgi:hypothetical protein
VISAGESFLALQVAHVHGNNAGVVFQGPTDALGCTHGSRGPIGGRSTQQRRSVPCWGSGRPCVQRGSGRRLGIVPRRELGLVEGVP